MAGSILLFGLFDGAGAVEGESSIGTLHWTAEGTLVNWSQEAGLVHWNSQDTRIEWTA